LLQIQVVESLHVTEASEIFRVLLDNLEYCVKVVFSYKGNEPGFADDGRDLCQYRCESQAYQVLHAHGVCELGIIPYFYGIFESFDPDLLGSALESFKGDPTPPCAILLEYLRDATSFEKASLSSEAIDMAVNGLKIIHGAHVVHNDAYPTKKKNPYRPGSY
ncbi:hypothetical protein P175DRAFT_0540080, partial [Aspergillus ochraceoroseus IBT 24754]